MKELSALNSKLKEMGLLELLLISPLDCIGLEVNARYMLPEKMNQLTENIKRSGFESVPLVFRDSELPKDKVRIVSGHHRIEAAKEAGLESILVMVCEPHSEEERRSKQLAHNALVGQDDETILMEILSSINDIELKLGIFKTRTLVFSPDDLSGFTNLLDIVENDISLAGSDDTRVVRLKDWDKLIKMIIDVKKKENIKNNGVAFTRLLSMIKDSENGKQASE